MINSKVKLEDKLELIHKFFVEVWNTDLIKDERPEPPTAEQMLKNINQATFPALKILEAEDLWMKARMFYYMAGEESMLHMDGDPTKKDRDEEVVRFYKSIEEEARYEQAFEGLSSENDEVYEASKKIIDDYENKRKYFRFCKFPVEYKREYYGTFILYKDRVLKIQTSDGVKEFNPLDIGDLSDFDLTRPINVHTVCFGTGKDGRERLTKEEIQEKEKISQISQESMTSYRLRQMEEKIDTEAAKYGVYPIIEEDETTITYTNSDGTKRKFRKEDNKELYE